MKRQKNSSVSKKRSVVPVMVALMMSVVMLAACSSSGSPQATSTPQASPGTQGSSTPASRPVLTIAIPSDPNVENFNTNYFTQLIEEQMEVDLQFFELPSNEEEALTRLSLMVSSGEKLPDIIAGLYLNEATIYDYASKGVLIQLDDYLNDPSIAEYFNQIPDEDRDFIYTNSRMPDQNVYSLSRYNPYAWNEGAYRAWINGEWLDQLSLSMPTTTDDFYDVLKAFTEGDPNGNNRRDEIGMVGSASGWGQNPRVFLMNAFLYANPEKGYLNVEDGEIIPAFTQPEWRAGLEYMRKLVEDGLLSALSFTQDSTQLRALINVEGGMAGVVPSGSYGAFGPELQNNMTLLAPISGPEGFSATPYNPTLPFQLWFITKDAADPELAFRVGDFLYSEEMSLVTRYGERGVDWSDDPEVTAQFVGSFEETEGITTKIAILDESLWTNPQNKHWRDVVPSYRSFELAKSSSPTRRDELDETVVNWHPLYGQTYASKFPEDVIFKLSYTPEELSQIANNKTVIEQYVNESAVAFITGNRPLSQWDTYLAELERMGLEEYLTITQAAYDRAR